MKSQINLFNIYIFLITLFKGLGATANDSLYIIAFAIGCSAIFIKIISGNFSRKELLTMAFIVFVGIINFVIGKTTTILFTAVGICGLKNINEKKVIRLVLETRFLTFIFMIIASSIGAIESNNLYFYRNGEYINRYAFGYAHPNIAHMSLVIIILLALYLYGEKMNLFHYMVLAGCNYILYCFTFSRTGFVIGIFSIMLMISFKYIKLQKLIMLFFKDIYIWMCLLTLCLGLSYERVYLINELDTLLTGRIYYINKLITGYFPPLFGNFHFNQYVYIDNGFIALLYQGGIFAFLWLSYYMVKLTHNLYQKKKCKELLLIGCFIIYGMFESFFPSISVNITLIFIGNIIFKKQTGALNGRNLYSYSNIQSKKSVKKTL